MFPAIIGPVPKGAKDKWGREQYSDLHVDSAAHDFCTIPKLDLPVLEVYVTLTLLWSPGKLFCKFHGK